MRNPLILVVLLIVIVLGFMLLSADSDREVVTPESTDTEETTSADPSAGTGAEVEEAVGNDAGMEFPDAADPLTIVTPNTGANQKVVAVSGVNFAFDVKEIRVKEGDTVTINFTSADGFHDLVIDEFNARTERRQTGGTSSVTFVADKKGTFEYYCSVGSHRVNGMVGKLIVE